ncbi:MAG: pyridoxal phosphate-dependent aminotransferase family protein [Parachlamydiales bacterium]|nr:pyridoxal phosphate-dependent aminotransferase family protein [Candidatus Acheromyda pituitae]
MTTAILNEHLIKRKQQNLMRILSSSEGLVDFASTDYLGFARSLELLESKADRIGSTGSRLLTGNHPRFEELEEKIARFHQAESCLLYNTGYTANLGLIAALGSIEPTFIYDLDIHVSMIDGICLSKAKSFAFRHNDLNSLEWRLKGAKPPTFVIVESIYSVSGDFAPLKELADLCLQYGAELIVDEAHATGVCGKDGRGCVAEWGLEEQVFARMHSFSKTLGSLGGCILGSQALKDYLINFSRPFIYTVAMPLTALSLIEAGYDKLAREAHVHQQRLRDLVSYFQKRLGITGTQSPIQPIWINGAEEARSLSEKLKNKGFDARALVSPTVKRGKECLRIVVHSFNQEEEIDRLAEAIK